VVGRYVPINLGISRDEVLRAIRSEGFLSGIFLEAKDWEAGL
jgi:hypothetical protein